MNPPEPRSNTNPADSAPDATLAASTALAKPNPLRRLYDWVLLWAQHPHASWALFILAFAEASFFPIPPDVLLLAMAMGAPDRALRFALVCTIGSVLGGIAGYTMGWGLWASVDEFFYHYVPGFSLETFEVMKQKFSDNTFLTIFAAGFTPIPFKVFTIAAGAAVVPFGLFLAGAIVSRGLRFGILAGMIMWLGPAVKLWIDRYFNVLSVVVTVLLVALVVLLRH